MEENKPAGSVFPEDETKEKFKSSEHVAFYRRQMAGPDQQHQALLDSLVLTERGASFQLLEVQTQTRLLVSLCPVHPDVVRVRVEELQPLKPRYRVPDVVMEELRGLQMRVDVQTDDSLTLGWSSGRHQLRLQGFPFRLDFLCGQEVLLTFNSGGKLWLERLQDRPSEDEDAASLWTETFRHFQDIKANGPSSIGVDMRLNGFSNVYGLPLHCDRLQLRDTSDGEPYRLYNLDVFAYELHSRLGLYGSVPLLVAHRPDRTVGIFWLNASETFVNIKYSEAQDEHPAVKRRRVCPHTDVRWLSESGLLDCSVLLGPGPGQLLGQYAQLTGFQALPPLFALGYHQCRWNYDDEADVKAVDAGFDRHDIPYDVIWLDIEHTDGKRYFTWDEAHFPDPAALQKHLDQKHRKLVVISDPHLKLDPDWSLYCQARDGGHLVKDRVGRVYQGSCWPGEVRPSRFHRLTGAAV